MDKQIKWALCPWFEESGEYLIHPDDLDRMKSFRPYGVVFNVLAEGGEYTKIGAGDDTFRVRPEALKLITPEASWSFKIGDSVSVVGRDDVGTIVSILWHHRENKPMYGLNIAGKLKSKRYWPEDLKKLKMY